jgi:hypothetical protein
VFYASADTYSLAHTCNTWTAEALQTGGAEVRADGVVLAGQVMDRARAAAVPPGAMPGWTAVRTPLWETER